jgi:hypothetical protein
MKGKIETEDLEMTPSGGITFGLIKKVKDSIELPPDLLLGHLLELRDSVDEAYFEIGGLLRKIYDKKMYADWGFKDFKGFVEEKVGFGLRKAQYLMNIWYYFAVEVKDEETIRKITKLGWAKCKELIGVVDPANVDEWVKKSIGSTVTEVSHMAAKHLAKGKEIEKAANLISFKLYEEQYKNVEDALILAHDLSGSDVRSNNLSYIALDFLSGHSGFDVKDPKIKGELLKNSLKSLELVFGIHLIAIDSKANVVYGESYVQK